MDSEEDDEEMQHASDKAASAMEAALEQKHLLHLGRRLASIAATGSADELRALHAATQSLPAR